MAKVNGKEMSFVGSTFAEIGEIIWATRKSNSEDILVELTEQEEMVFVSTFGMKVGYAIAELIVDAAEKETGVRPSLEYVYENCIFMIKR